MPTTSWEFLPMPWVSKEGSLLLIESATELVKGTYVCVAKNRMERKAKKSYQLDVTNPASMYLTLSSCCKQNSIVIWK
jgi:hypothetical protein